MRDLMRVFVHRFRMRFDVDYFSRQVAKDVERSLSDRLSAMLSEGGPYA